MSEEEPVPDQIDLPKDRELALHEVNSILTELQSRYAQMHFYTKREWARDRFVGWTIFALLMGLLTWSLVYQYASTQDLRRSLYETCVDNNARAEAQRALYAQVAKEAPEGSNTRVLLGAAAARITSRNCQGLYLK